MKVGKFKLVKKTFELLSVVNQSIQLFDVLAKQKQIQINVSIGPDVPIRLYNDQNRIK